MKYLFFMIAAFGVSNAHARSYVIGGSNLPIMGYEEPRCSKPSKPIEPFTKNKYTIDSYNFDVQRYNSNRRIYISCIKTYVENAQNDIRRIEAAIEDAIDEANRDY